VDKQGGYSVEFKGTLLYWLALDEISEQGEVSAETDNQIKTLFDEWVADESTIKKYEYRNSGRAYVEYFNMVTDDSTLDLSDSFGLPLIISVSQDGIITITEEATENEGLPELLKLGYKLDGVIEITSDLLIIDSGGQKARRKFIVTGPYLIKQIFTSFPTHDVIIKIKKE
jgi:hypothetical protein